MKDIPTKEKIMDAAEKLFVDNGFSATSLRAIIKEADVNTAAVHYHFGSKEGLVVAVFDRRIGDLNQERLDMLADYQARDGDRPVPLEDVLRAFLVPVIRRNAGFGGEEAIPRLMGRLVTEPDPVYRQVAHSVFKETASKFSQAVARALPGLSREEVEWRMHLVVGAMVSTVIVPRFHAEKATFFKWSKDPEEMTERLVRFLAAGMRAPTPEAAGKDTK